MPSAMCAGMGTHESASEGTETGGALERDGGGGGGERALAEAGGGAAAAATAAAAADVGDRAEPASCDDCRWVIDSLPRWSDHDAVTLPREAMCA
jgi:hypothetical protein